MAYERSDGLAFLKKVVDSTKKVLDDLVIVYEGDRKGLLAGIFERRTDMVDSFPVNHKKSVVKIGSSDDRKRAVLRFKHLHIRCS